MAGQWQCNGKAYTSTYAKCGFLAYDILVPLYTSESTQLPGERRHPDANGATNSDANELSRNVDNMYTLWGNPPRTPQIRSRW
jgi:hypothetical protein